MINTITLAGYVSNISGEFKTEKGSHGFQFTLAHTEKKNGGESTIFVPILIWGDMQVERVKDLGVGDFVMVAGQLAQYKSADKEKPATRIKAYHVLFNKKQKKEEPKGEEEELPF